MGRVIREDKQRLSELYTQIANCIVGDLLPGWTHFCLCFAVDAAQCETILVYYSLDGGISYRDLADKPRKGVADAQTGCQDLFQLCRAAGDRWTQFCLCVNAKGEFRADHCYDTLGSFTPLHQQVWRGRYLKVGGGID